MTAAQLDAARCPRSYWPYALRNSVFIKNRTPHAALDGVMPIEAWTGEKPDLTGLRTFGCAAYAPVPKEKRRKLDAKAVRGILVGHAAGKKAYEILLPDQPTVVVSLDVIFAEKGIATDAPTPPLPALTLRHPQQRTDSTTDTEVSPPDTDEEKEVGEGRTGGTRPPTQAPPRWC
ncbi:hypothetical protein JCM1841_006590 [Sporobolomyces salmonicolor]